MAPGLDSSFGTSVGTTIIVLMLSMLMSFLNLGYKAAHLELMKHKLEEGKRLKQVLACCSTDGLLSRR